MLVCIQFAQLLDGYPLLDAYVRVGQWWANYGPRARCGPLRGSIRPAADFKIIVYKFSISVFWKNSCNNCLKQLFLNLPKLEFFKSLSKSSFPNLISHAQKVSAMFASSYICEQVFSTTKLRKSCIRNILTDEHLASLLRISTSRFEPDYEELLEMQSQLHSSH